MLHKTTTVRKALALALAATLVMTLFIGAVPYEQLTIDNGQLTVEPTTLAELGGYENGAAAFVGIVPFAALSGDNIIDLGDFAPNGVNWWGPHSMDGWYWEWSTSTSTNIFTVAGNVTVTGTLPSGASIVVANNGVLIVASGTTLTNNGTITNNGIIYNYGTINNHGTITGTDITGGGTVRNYVGINLTGFDFGIDHDAAYWEYDADTRTFYVNANLTVTVTGTATGLTQAITFDLENGATLRWQAYVSGSVSGTVPDPLDGYLVRVNHNHSRLYIESGRIESAGTNGSALLASGEGGMNFVTGGSIIATGSGSNAIRTSAGLQISGGLVMSLGHHWPAYVASGGTQAFIHGTAMLFGIGNNVSSSFQEGRVNTSAPSFFDGSPHEATVIWLPALPTTATVGAPVAGLQSFPAGATGVWANQGGVGGILYTTGGRTGFIPIPGLAVNPTTTPCAHCGNDPCDGSDPNCPGYAPETYIIIFLYNYTGASEPHHKVTRPIAAPGEPISAPSQPGTRYGTPNYYFHGWYTTPATISAAHFPIEVSGNRSFYARWANTPPIPATSITVYPLAPNTPIGGGVQYFSSTVYPEGAHQGVNWSIDGTPICPGTYIVGTSSARLTVGPTETAALTIRAISTSTPGVFGTATMTVTNIGDSNGGNGGISGIITRILPRTVRWLYPPEAATLMRQAAENEQAFTRTRHDYRMGVRAAAWQTLAGRRFEHDTVDARGVQVRLFIDNPSQMSGDVLVSGWVTGNDVNWARSHFARFFSNQIRVVHFDHSGEWGQTVRAAARVDLTGMDVNNLHFYSFNRETNTYRRIPAPAHRIDANGFLHFNTPFAGSIVISDGPLVRR